MSHGRDPSFALTTSTAVFSRHGVFPRSAWATHSAELYRQPGRPHQEGRSTRTPLVTSGTWNYRATVRYLAPDGQAAEVRQVHVDEHGNQDAPCFIMMNTAIVKPQDFQRQDDAVIQAHVRHSACMSIPRTVFSCREHMALAPSHSPDRGDKSRHLRKLSGRSMRHDFTGLVSCIGETPITTTTCISMDSLFPFRPRLRVGTTWAITPTTRPCGVSLALVSCYRSGRLTQLQ